MSARVVVHLYSEAFGYALDFYMCCHNIDSIGVTGITGAGESLSLS